MAISKELLLAILSMDSYNRGYGIGLETGVEKVGAADILIDSEAVFKDPAADPDEASPAFDAGFYAVAYTVGEGVDGIAPGTTVISYRGTDKLWGLSDRTPWSDAPGGDIWNSYAQGAGLSLTRAAHLAADFFQAVTDTSETDPTTGSAILTGHSMGGGLAGFSALAERIAA